MKTFNRLAAQGEITIRRIGDLPPDRTLPSGYDLLLPENGRYVVGHSETGHHHTIDADGATVGTLSNPPEGMRMLYMILEKPLNLEHQRPHDTHDTLTNEPGVYEVRIAREFDPYAKLARLAAD